jgi:hypothetical protein
MNQKAKAASRKTTGKEKAGSKTSQFITGQIGLTTLVLSRAERDTHAETSGRLGSGKSPKEVVKITNPGIS